MDVGRGILPEADDAVGCDTCIAGSRCFDCTTVAEPLAVAFKPGASDVNKEFSALFGGAFPGFCPRLMVVRPGTSPRLAVALLSDGSTLMPYVCDVLEVLENG